MQQKNQQNEVYVIYALVTCFFACLIDLLTAKWMNDSEKDLEIALLRQQLRIVERRQERGPHIARCQKVPLAILVNRLRGHGQQAKERPGGDSLTLQTGNSDELVSRTGTEEVDIRSGTYAGKTFELIQNWNTGLSALPARIPDWDMKNWKVNLKS